MKNIKVIFYACIFIIHGIHSNIFTHLSNLGLGCISSMKQSNHSLKKCIRLFPFFFSVNFLTEFISKKVVESKGFSKEKMPKKDISQTLYSYITNSSIYYLSNIAANITMNRSFKENHRIYAGISLFFLSLLMIKNSYKTSNSLLPPEYVHDLSIQRTLLKAIYFSLGNILFLKFLNNSSITFLRFEDEYKEINFFIPSIALSFIGIKLIAEAVDHLKPL